MSNSIHRRATMYRVLLRLAVVLGLAALIGLVSTNPAPAGADACPTSNSPNTMILVGGTPQTAKLYQPFAEMLQVTLANTNGCPITTQTAGTPVTFTAPSSGASGTFSASGSNTLIVGANASGAASGSGFVANGTAGSYTITASSSYGSVSFSLTNTASRIAATITPASPQSRSAMTGSRYPQPLQATVRDANGNPVDGASVTFTLGASTGSSSGAATAGANFDGGSAQATVLTNASGTATSALFTANITAGTFTATASTAGVVESAVFTLDNLAGRPPTISALAPAKQSVTIGRRYGKPLQVKVLDGNGNPLQGATVTFSLGPATSGGGGAGGSASAGAGASFVDGSSVASQPTDASGVATSPRFTANTSAGLFRATATTTGTTEAATFSLDNLAGRPPSIINIGTPKRSATVGARYAKALQVRVRDGSGRPMQGASVTFALGASAAAGSAAGAGATFVGGSGQATELTNASGVATSPRLTANTTAGIFTATATTTGTIKTASFALYNRPGKPATIFAGVAATESTALRTRFPVRLAVTITDKNGNTVAGVAVRFTAPASGASGRFNGKKRVVTVKTDAEGVAVAPPFVANRTPGGYVVSATAHRHAAAFALVNQPAG